MLTDEEVDNDSALQHQQKLMDGEPHSQTLPEGSTTDVPAAESLAPSRVDNPAHDPSIESLVAEVASPLSTWLKARAYLQLRWLLRDASDWQRRRATKTMAWWMPPMTMDSICLCHGEWSSAHIVFPHPKLLLSRIAPRRARCIAKVVFAALTTPSRFSARFSFH